MARCSAYNFYRMFSFITDVSLTEYTRKRRLTLAAIELQSSEFKVIDLALSMVTIHLFHFRARSRRSTGLRRRKRAPTE